MTRAAIVAKVEQASDEALVLIEAVLDAASRGKTQSLQVYLAGAYALDAAGRGETPSPWDPAWQTAVHAMDAAAEALAQQGRSDEAQALAHLIDELTRLFPVVEQDDPRPDEIAALEELEQEPNREPVPLGEVERELGLR